VPEISLEGFFNGTERLGSLSAKSGLHDGWKNHYQLAHSRSCMGMRTAVGRTTFSIS